MPFPATLPCPIFTLSVGGATSFILTSSALTQPEILCPVLTAAFHNIIDQISNLNPTVLSPCGHLKFLYTPRFTLLLSHSYGSPVPKLVFQFDEHFLMSIKQKHSSTNRQNQKGKTTQISISTYSPESLTLLLPPVTLLLPALSPGGHRFRE